MILTLADLKALIQAALNEIPAGTDQDRRAWLVVHLTQSLLAFENKNAVIAEFVQNPLVREAEKDAVRILVEYVFDSIKTVPS